MSNWEIVRFKYGARERADETGRGFLARRGENEAAAPFIGYVRFRFHRHRLH
jgi:hypothetical protein